jgi:hypothetical protein
LNGARTVIRDPLTNAPFSDSVIPASRVNSNGPQDVSLGTTDTINLTGGGDGSRPIRVAEAVIPKGERTLNRYFNTDAFARTPAGNIGNTPRDVFRGPGMNNWDITVFKLYSSSFP